MTGTVEEAGISPKKVTVDLESEEVLGRGVGCEEPRVLKRLGVFGEEWATVVATSADSGRRVEKVNSEYCKCDNTQGFSFSLCPAQC